MVLEGGVDRVVVIDTILDEAIDFPDVTPVASYSVIFGPVVDTISRLGFGMSVGSLVGFG